MILQSPPPHWKLIGKSPPLRSVGDGKQTRSKHILGESGKRILVTLFS